MSARESLSTAQFGFVREQLNVNDIPSSGTTRPARIPLRNLVATQDSHEFDPKTVAEYVGRRGTRDRFGLRPQVTRYNGEHVVFNGHHRIAAALRRGQKTMTVDLDRP